MTSAAEYGYAEVAKLLLDRGAEINAGQNYSQSALSRAANEGHQEVVACLLERGARWGLQDALKQGDLDLFGVLLDEEIARDAERWGDEYVDPDRHSAVDDVSGDFDRITMDAVGLGRIEIVKLLLDRGAANLVEHRDKHTLLAEASKQGHLAIVRLLIDRGADLHATGRDELTPLAYAIKEGRTQVAELLRQAGAER